MYKISRTPGVLSRGSNSSRGLALTSMSWPVESGIYRKNIIYGLSVMNFYRLTDFDALLIETIPACCVSTSQKDYLPAMVPGHRCTREDRHHCSLFVILCHLVNLIPPQSTLHWVTDRMETHPNNQYWEEGRGRIFYTVRLCSLAAWPLGYFRSPRHIILCDQKWVFRPVATVNKQTLPRGGAELHSSFPCV